MLNRFKDAVNKTTPKNNDGDDRPPPPPKSEKYCYSRPHFLGLNFDESSACRDFGLRPIMTPRDLNQIPLQAGYAECINGGKSDYNEDQATATELHLTRKFRTDISMSCLDISLSSNSSHSQEGMSSPGPSSPVLNHDRKTKSSSPKKVQGRRAMKQASDNPTPLDDSDIKETAKDSLEKDPLKSAETDKAQVNPEVEMTEFASLTSAPTEKEPSINTQSKNAEKKREVSHNIANQQNHVRQKHDDQSMTALYFGLFDGHASHTVSLIVSKLLHMLVKEKLELCLGVMQRIKMVQGIYKRGDNCTDVTIEQLVTGVLEEAFMNMDDLLDREKTTYHIKGGCTAIVALFCEGKLYVANAGDSRAVLCHGDHVKAMSHDFTAESEKKRLNELAFSQPELLGGEFTCYEFYHRVSKLDIGKHVICRMPGRSGWTLKVANEDDLKFPLIVGTGKRTRIMGTIGVTRCLGDHDLYVYDSDIWIKPFLSPLPEVRVLDLTKSEWSADDVLIIASDGLWDCISNEKAVKIVRNVLKQPCTQAHEKYTIAAQELVQEARGLFTGRGWKKSDDEMASFDDITVFVIPLKKYADSWRMNKTGNKASS